MSQEIPFTCFVQILRRFLSTVKIAIYRTKTRLKAIIKISKQKRRSFCGFVLTPNNFHIYKELKPDLFILTHIWRILLCLCQSGHQFVS